MMWPFNKSPGPLSITMFALVCVGIIMVFLFILTGILIHLLQSDWCSVAIGSAQYANGRPDFAVAGCIDLLKLQVQAFATNSWITIGIFGAVLFVLMVIVVARGRASVSAPGGFGASVGGEELPATPAEGAAAAAGAAADVAADLAEGEAPDVAGKGGA